MILSVKTSKACELLGGIHRSHLWRKMTILGYAKNPFGMWNISDLMLAKEGKPKTPCRK